MIKLLKKGRKNKTEWQSYQIVQSIVQFIHTIDTLDDSYQHDQE